MRIGADRKNKAFWHWRLGSPPPGALSTTRRSETSLRAASRACALSGASGLGRRHLLAGADAHLSSRTQPRHLPHLPLDLGPEFVRRGGNRLYQYP